VGGDVDEDVEDCGVIDSGLVEERDLPLLFAREPEWISKDGKEGIAYLSKNVRWHLCRCPLNKMVFVEVFE